MALFRVSPRGFIVVLMKEKIKEFVRFQIKRLRRSVRRTAGKIVIRETTVDFEEMGIVRECPGIFWCCFRGRRKVVQLRELSAR